MGGRQAAALVAPVPVVVVPAGHGVAEIAPGVSTYEPTGALRHDDWPSSG